MEGQEPTMSRFRSVGEAEPVQSRLEDIRVHDRPSFSQLYVANVLDGRFAVFGAVDLGRVGRRENVPSGEAGLFGVDAATERYGWRAGE